MRSARFEEMIRVALALDNQYRDENIGDVVHFSQMWGSTTLGFGGIGGQALTSAITSVIFRNDGKIDVLFGGRKAYTVPKMNQAFFDDLSKRCLKSVSESSVYRN